MNNTNVNLYYYYRNYVSILPISCHGYHKFEILGYLKKNSKTKIIWDWLGHLRKDVIGWYVRM